MDHSSFQSATEAVEIAPAAAPAANSVLGDKPAAAERNAQPLASNDGGGGNTAAAAAAVVVVAASQEKPPEKLKLLVTTEELELKKRGYLLGATLGEGSYAKVKSAFNEKTQKRVAVKIINRKKAPLDFQQKFLPREIAILELIRHPNIVNMLEIFNMKGKVYIVMEMAGHGDLLEYIKLRGRIAEPQSAFMFQQIVNGIEYLHKQHVTHRDMKCENILLDANNSVKISDFGFAKRFTDGEKCHTFCGSAAYAAPEILQGIPYEPMGYDVWSVGVILYIMVCGSMPFDDSNIKKMIREQTERKVGFSHHRHVSDNARHLIHSILEADIAVRYKVPQIQKHAWLVQNGSGSGGSGGAGGSSSHHDPLQKPKGK